MSGEEDLAFLEVRDVVVCYERSEILHGVRLNVATGELVALLGASGSGKTTLLRAIAGFAPVQTGRILVAGEDVTRAPPERRGMAMVFQSYALWPHMSVAQNIGYGLKLRGVSTPERAHRVDALLDMLTLSGMGDRNVTKLSGGQRQRVALGRALAIEPKILLLDEPLSNLDARIRLQLRHEIKTLQQRLGITTIHVTHDREEAMTLADRIVVMDAGKVLQVGTPKDLYANPVSPLVATVMGSDNVLLLAIERDGGSARVAASEWNQALTLGEYEIPEGRRLVAHFRSGAAHFEEGATRGEPGLVLLGHVKQCVYPGGVYRHTVTAGDRELMVDDVAPRAPGSKVAVKVPLERIQFFQVEGVQT